MIPDINRRLLHCGFAAALLSAVGSVYGTFHGVLPVNDGCFSGRVFVVSIGVDQYGLPGQPLSGTLASAQKDARAFPRRIKADYLLQRRLDSARNGKDSAAVFQPKLVGEHAKAQCRIERIDSTVLLGKDATLDNVRKTFARISREAVSSDRLIVFYAGAGLVRPLDQSSRGVSCESPSAPSCAIYLPLAEMSTVRVPRPEDPPPSPEVAVSLSMLARWIAAVPALEQLIVLDACAYPAFGSDLARDLQAADRVNGVGQVVNRNRVIIRPSGQASEDAEQGELTRAVLAYRGYFLSEVFDGARMPLVAYKLYAAAFPRPNVRFASKSGLPYLLVERDRLIAPPTVVTAVASAADSTSAHGGLAPAPTNRAVAIVVGTNKYEGHPGFGPLSNAVNDARAVGQELGNRYGFEIDSLFNPTVAQFATAVERWKRVLGPKDQLLVYVAGHGVIDPSSGLGSLAFADGRTYEEDPLGRTLLDHTKLLNMLDIANSEHVMVLLDACHSGAFADAAAKRGIEVDSVAGAGTRMQRLILERGTRRTRVFFTSGASARDGVSDGPPGGHSPFAAQILDALRSGGGDLGLVTTADIARALDRVDGPLPRRGEFGKKNEPGADFVLVARK